MRAFVLGLLVAAGIFVGVTLIWGRPASQVPALPPVAESSLPPIVPPTPPPSASAPGDCDETEELMARMFVGLTQAVLTESDTSPEEFAAAIAVTRETWKRYLQVLDIPSDPAWFYAAVSPDLDQRFDRCLAP